MVVILVLLLLVVLLVHLGIEYSIVILSIYIPVVVGFGAILVLVKVVRVTPLPKVAKYNFLPWKKHKS